MPPSESDALLIEQIRAGDSASWTEFIGRYEGRLLAFAESRLHHRAASEDVVQETFVGFLTSLPNYDTRRPLETWLFSIAAHKLTDHLRREGRRPALPLSSGAGSDAQMAVPDRRRAASSMVRSRERRHLEESALVPAMRDVLDRWRQQGEWQKLRCMELLFVAGRPNKEVAQALALSEQAVANLKFDFLARLRTAMRRHGLPDDVFPELAEN
jgi:RNA polymerase sigma-70 factor (ECF subfamily)